MKVICNKSILSDNINIVLKAVSGRTTLPILECILLSAKGGGEGEEGFRLIANDLEMGIETKNIEADIIEEGDIALDAKVFSDIVRRAPGEDVFIETKNNNITIIKSGESEYKILGQSGEEFPFLPEVEKENGFEISSTILKNIIKQTIFSVSADESKPPMTGELFDISDGVLKIVSVDGFRISVRNAGIDNRELSSKVIVPGKTLNEINKILPSNEKSITSVYLSDKHIMFETEEATVVSRLIEGNFIDYENVFLTDCTTFLTVGCEELESSLERASLISREAKKSPVKLSINSDKSLVTVDSQTETGTFFEEVNGEIDGLSLEIAFNPRFLTDILKAVDEEKVQLLFTTPLSPCIIKSVENNDYKYLVLPLRIKN